jgi:hypothetical protein
MAPIGSSNMMTIWAPWLHPPKSAVVKPVVDTTEVIVRKEARRCSPAGASASPTRNTTATAARTTTA